MDRYDVLIYPKAFRDIDGIYDYIAREIQEQSTAKKQTDRIWDAIATLSVFPKSHQERLTGRYSNKGYRQLLIDNFVAIFKIDEAKRKVFVVTIQYQDRTL